jgi:AraC family transcriptional activator of pobA
MNIAEVAYSLGFEDPAYFSRFFTRQTGVSPRTFVARSSAEASS